MGCTRGGNCPSSLSLSGHKKIRTNCFFKSLFHGFRKQMWVKKECLLKLKSCRQTSKNDKISSKKKVATTAAMWRAVVYAVLAANRVLMGATSCYTANLFSNFCICHCHCHCHCPCHCHCHCHCLCVCLCQFFWSYHVFLSLWTNVSKVTSL